MNWLIKQKVNLNSPQAKPLVLPEALMLTGDDRAHVWQVEVLGGSAPADLAGATCRGYFLRADGQVVLIEGQVAGNMLQVTLTGACYEIPGSLSAALRVYKGGATMTVATALFSVGKSQTDVVLGPETTIPSVLALDKRMKELDMAVEALASGSPAGVYATLADLQAAKPSGDNKVYVVSGDGKWYYWSGSAWTAGGVYQSSGLILDAALEDSLKASEASAVGYALRELMYGMPSDERLRWSIGGLTVGGEDAPGYPKLIRANSFTVPVPSSLYVEYIGELSHVIILYENGTAVVSYTDMPHPSMMTYSLLPGKQYRLVLGGFTTNQSIMDTLRYYHLRIASDTVYGNLRIRKMYTTESVAKVVGIPLLNGNFLSNDSFEYSEMLPLPNNVRFVTFAGSHNPSYVMFYKTTDYASVIGSSKDFQAQAINAEDYKLHRVPHGAAYFCFATKLVNNSRVASCNVYFVSEVSEYTALLRHNEPLNDELGYIKEDGSSGVFDVMRFKTLMVPDNTEAIYFVGGSNLYPNYVHCYNSAGSYLGRTRGQSYGSIQLKSTHMFVHNLPMGTRMVKFMTKASTGSGAATITSVNVFSCPGSDSAPCSVDAQSNRLLYAYGDNADPAGHADVAGTTVRFTVPVNCYKPDNDSTAVSLQDGEQNYLDHGFLMLPTSYTRDGTPTRLVICCHGAGGEVSAGDSQMEHFVIVKYLVANGYAVMDMNGLPSNYAVEQGINSMNNIGCPIAVQAYINGYHYCLEHYNLKRDGVLLYGASMGGISSTNLADSGCIPVIAHALHCPVLDTYEHIWQRPWSGGLPKTAMIKLYDFVDSGGGNYVYDESKLIGYNPAKNNSITVSGQVYKRYPCPVKIWHAVNDTTVIIAPSQAFVQAIKNHNGVAYLRTLSSGGHAPYDAGDAIASPAGSVVYRGETLSIKPVVEETFLWLRRFDV